MKTSIPVLLIKFLGAWGCLWTLRCLNVVVGF